MSVRFVEKVEPPKLLLEEPNIPHKLLLGPGPSNASEKVLQAMTAPLLGHLHPEFLKIMDDVKAGVQYVLQTRSRYTFAISGTGHSGMEAALANLLEPGDRLLVADAGIWAHRAADLADRLGAVVTRVAAPQLGGAVRLQDVEKALSSGERYAAVFVCHGESSTGVLQPLEGFGELCQRHGDTLFIVDTVAALGAAPFNMDELQIDCVYSATQKALSCPPGLAPIAFSDRAWKRIIERKTRPFSFYMDAQHLANYWGCLDEPRRYHHTGEISTVYALRAGLAAVVEEGLSSMLQRHADSAALLHAKLHEIGLELLVAEPAHRNPAVTAVKVPEGVDWKLVTGYLMERGVEVAGGLGPTAGKIWRIGLMGQNSTSENVEKVVKLLSEALNDQKK